MEAGAEGLQQRGLFDVHRGWNQVRVSDRRDGELGKSARERGGRCAQMEAAGAARTAIPAVAEGIECDSIADFEIGDSRADLDDFARGLVSENYREARDHALGAEFPIDDVQIGAAYAARADANQ